MTPIHHSSKFSAFLHSPTESAPAPAPPPAREPPIPLSFVFAHVSRSWLPILARVSKRFSAAMQLALYGTLDLSADDTDATGHALAADPTRRCTSLRITSMIFSPPVSHTPGATPLRRRAPIAQDVPSAVAPCLAVLDNSPCLAAALARSLYDGLHPATLFVIGALGNTRAGLEVLDLSLEGTFDEVSYQALYKKVSSLLPNLLLRTNVRRVLRCGHDLRWD
ncbi:hypothetical protein EDB86DRAFT_3088631 [Lactarius hatsudake]|nr:hypothetical protein EDB86DRAFT_3088631 [Lactarius hatsudake]